MPLKTHGYFIDKDLSSKLTPEQLRAAKFNNHWLMAVFTKLVESNGNNIKEIIGNDNLPGILCGKLPRSDQDTGIDSEKLGEKLRFLAQELQTPQGKLAFQQSFFFQLIEAFRRGTIDYTKKDCWISYEYISNSDPKYANKEPFTAACLCHARDEKTPVGINFYTLIDSLIGEENGNYKIKTLFDPLDRTAKGTEMTEACAKHLNVLKNNKHFKECFIQDDGIALS